MQHQKDKIGKSSDAMNDQETKNKQVPNFTTPTKQPTWKWILCGCGDERCPGSFRISDDGEYDFPNGGSPEQREALRNNYIDRNR